MTEDTKILNDRVDTLTKQVEDLTTFFSKKIKAANQGLEDLESQVGANNFSGKKVERKQLIVKDQILVGDHDDVAILSVTDSLYRFWVGAANPAAAPFRITKAGVVTASSLSLTGGTISYGKTSFADSANAGYYLSSSGFYVGSALDASYLQYVIGTGVFNIKAIISTLAGSVLNTTYLSGLIPQGNLNVADRGWTQTSAFSVTDADTIAWGAGIFTSADGTAYNISAGNTGNMVAKTYIYLDTAVSTTVYQTTTTSANAVGAGKVMIGIAQNGTTEATYMIMQGQGGYNIDAANIVAGSITANEIAASTITAGKMNISTLSSISANIGSITSGTITGALIRTSSGGDRIEMKDDNTITFYSGGYTRTFISNGILGFSTPLGVGSGSIYGYGTEEMVIDTGNSPYHFNASAFFPDSFVADLGKSTDKWRDGYFSRDLYVGDDLFVTDYAEVGGDLDVAGTIYGTLDLAGQGGIDQSSTCLNVDGTTWNAFVFTDGLLTAYLEF